MVIISDDNRHAVCTSRPEWTFMSVHLAVANFRDSGKYLKRFNREALVGRKDAVWATSREEAAKKIAKRLEHAGMTVFCY